MLEISLELILKTSHVIEATKIFHTFFWCLLLSLRLWNQFHKTLRAGFTFLI